MKRAASLLILSLGLAVVPALGQGCAMCATSADAADENGKRALSRAVLVLLAPALGLGIGMVGLTVRYGRKQEYEREK